MYLLDTDVLIDIQRGHAPALVWFASLTELPSIPGIVVMELIQGAQNAQQVRAALKVIAPCLWYGRRSQIATAPSPTLPPITCRTA